MGLRLIPRTQSAHDAPLLIHRLLDTPLRQSPDQTIHYRDERTFTYKQLYERICRLAGALSKLGIGQGDTVAVMDWDSNRYLEAFFAVPMLGAVLHTINVRLSPEQMLYTINHAKDDVILVNADFLPLLDGFKDRMPSVKRVVLMRDAAHGDAMPETALELAGEYEALLDEAPAEHHFELFDENAMATVFYTTGTTGDPKGVYFSHRQLVLHTLGTLTALTAFRCQTNIDSGAVYMPITPMFHVHAWGFPYAMTLLGAKQIYPGRYEPAMLLRLLSEHDVTLSHCVPTILHMLVSSEAVKSVDLSRWAVIIGGSALPQGLCRAALELGINVYTGYGMSETCPVLTLANLKPNLLDLPLAEQVQWRCRTGLAVPLVQLELHDANGARQPHDGKSAGEVVVRTPWLTQGYLDDSERSEQLWRGGWLHTGDVATIDAEGYLQITDRIKDVIKTGGEWVSSLELENVLSKHEAVSEVAVVGVADERWGERPVAVVVPRIDLSGPVSEADLKALFAPLVEDGTLSSYAVPDRVLFRDQLPKTSVGKIDKKVLRQDVAQALAD
ncbi:MAG: fatty acid--CoA ligase [Myxococcales bacterium]|nr:fatty acid--CoA ligase [Myxococcales bacterium]